MVLFALCDMLGLARPCLYLSVSTKPWYKQVIVEAANVKVEVGAWNVSK